MKDMNVSSAPCEMKATVTLSTVDLLQSGAVCLLSLNIVFCRHT